MAPTGGPQGHEDAHRRQRAEDEYVFQKLFSSDLCFIDFLNKRFQITQNQFYFHQIQKLHFLK